MNRRLTSVLAIAVIASGAGAAQAQAADFDPNNVVIYRVGDGSTALTNAATAVFLDEYTPAGTFVRSVALRTAISGLNKRLTASGTATSEGLLTRSTNGRYLLATGYDAALGTTGVASTSTTGGSPVLRVVGVIDGSGAADTTTALEAFSGNNVRGAASTDGNDIWITGANTGVLYATRGATGPSFVVVSSTQTSLRGVNIFGNQLFVSTGAGSTFRVGTVGTGTPKTTSQTTSNLPGFPTTGSPYQFVLLDLIAGVGFGGTGLDTLYVADDSAGAIQKYRFNGSNFAAVGTATLTSVRGLTVYATGGNVTLFATNGTNLATLSDPAAATSTLSGTPTSIATAGTNTAFRGVALAPIAPTAVSWRGGKAVPGVKGVLVSWKTGREADNLGFDVLRVRKGSARRVKVTRKLITGSALSGASGNSGSYRFRDPGGKPGDKYFVVSRATDGNKKVYGPLVARSSTRKASR